MSGKLAFLHAARVSRKLLCPFHRYPRTLLAVTRAIMTSNRVMLFKKQVAPVADLGL